MSVRYRTPRPGSTGKNQFPSSLCVQKLFENSEELALVSCTGDIVTWEEIGNMIAAVRGFYRRHPDLEIRAENAKHQYSEEEITQHRNPKPKKRTGPIPGYVYLIQLGDTGYYKIGKTKNISDRIAHFSPVFPEEPVVLCLIKSLDYSALERYLHKKYSRCRANGEWFRLTPKDIKHIKGLANDG